MSEAPSPPTFRLSQLLDEGEDQARAAYEARESGIPNGPAIRFSPALAEELCGSLPVGLNVLHGPPGSGKSALGQQLAAYAECPALIVTFEMAPLELLRRATACVTSTYVNKLRNGTMTPEAWRANVQRAAKAFPNLGILDGTRQMPVTIKNIQAALSDFRGDSKHALVVIDSCSAWVRRRSEDGTEYEATNKALQELQQLAQVENCAVLAIAEQNRSQRDTNRQDAAAGTRVYEYGSEVVLALERPPNVEPDNTGTLDVTLTLSKNRLGTQGRRIPLRFRGGFMRFEEIEKDTSTNEARESEDVLSFEKLKKLAQPRQRKSAA